MPKVAETLLDKETGSNGEKEYKLAMDSLFGCKTNGTKFSEDDLILKIKKIMSWWRPNMNFKR